MLRIATLQRARKEIRMNKSRKVGRENANYDKHYVKIFIPHSIES